VDETGAPNPGCWEAKLNVHKTGAPNPGCWKAKLKVHSKNVNIIGEKNANDECD